MDESKETPQPSQVKTECPAPPANHPVHTKWKGWLPGKMGYANSQGHFPGCLIKIFRGEYRGEVPESWVEASQIANEWFAANPGLLVVDVRYGVDAILVIFTKIIDREEQEEWDEVQYEARRLIDERKEARAAKVAEAETKANEAKVKAEAAAKEEEKELKRLAELGRRHEKNCSKAKQ